MTKAAERRALIEKTALGLFARDGFAAVSIRDISEASGIGQSGLYRHMKSKDELAIRIFRTAYLGFAEQMLAAEDGKTLEEKLSSYLDVVLSSFDEDPTLVLFLLGRQHDVLAKAIKASDITPLTVLRDAVCIAMGRKEIAQQDPDILTAMILGAAFQPLTFISYGRIPAPAAALKPQILSTILRLAGYNGADA